MTHATATLIAEDAHEAAPGWRRLVIDCQHATTVGWIGPGADEPPLVQAARSLVQLHHERERCACTRELRWHYGLTRTQ